MANRIDASLVLRNGMRLQSPSSHIELSRDASYSPDETLTVIQTTSTKVGDLPWPRLAFRVDLVATTTAPTVSAALDEADVIGDAVLALTQVGDVRVSSVTCGMEPQETTPHNPSGAAMVTARYSMIVRRA